MSTYRSNAIGIKGLHENTLENLESKIKDTLEIDLKGKVVIDIKYAHAQNDYTALIIYDKGIS
ncbi:hypothetical protein ACFHWD_00840 [Clostridium sp. MT-14]|uniref:Sporulation protein Cse60 n=1 Tax=Clostridium aromativorans TaxID=2836848 RepID=A0ABS8N0U3_9CLOT|nr:MULTISPECIES: hypothetical protein [Clostridium]KAA8672668.1 hypothetical protein F3O63_10160 [Clostridium sp. HV4-5-A1G]MCC9293419.1 hypothetical protein [Clostridium aromativorans]CAB1252586.1 conserved hypothetical protein [Clostridiaceae bacterium BL-3]